MANKRELYHRLLQLRHIKTWQLLIMLVLALIVTASLLRMNNLGMIERRAAVIQTDESGDTGAIRKTLLELQHYVTRHMNTSLGSGVYLSASYDRDREAAIQRAADVTNPNSAIYQQASVECRARWQGGVASFRNDYVTCVVEKVSALSAAQNLATEADLPRLDNYRYNFVSPLWTPDVAGFAVLFCVVLALVIVMRLVALAVLRSLVRRRFSHI